MLADEPGALVAAMLMSEPSALLITNWPLEPILALTPGTADALMARARSVMVVALEGWIDAGLGAVNAMSAGAALGDHIIDSLGLGERLARAASE